MSYQVLYRRFRPQTFSEVVGQDHITSILRNQVKSGQVSHAYLFSGSKGTGKTSTAKIFARAVNCLDPQDGEPCGVCDYCRSIKNNQLSDIIEIDAASNRGIDEIRDLKEKVNYLPATGRYRVYIIDEVHMLTTEAFNALLKTLEDPPEHIIFIFATTEPHKILPTILSRCQRFDFSRISQETITNTLRNVLKQIDIDAEENALQLIAANSDGALRDALSFADQAINIASSNILTVQDAQDALGLASNADIYRLGEAVLDENINDAFVILQEMQEKGSDISHIVSQLTEYFRALMIFLNTKEPEKILGHREALLTSLDKCEKNISPEILITYISALSKTKNDTRYLPHPRYLLEATLLRLSDRSQITTGISLNARVDRLEKQIENLKNMRQSFSSETISEKSTDVIEEEYSKQPSSTISDASPQKELPKTDKDTLIEIQKAVEFAGKFIHNKERDIMLGDLFSCMKVASVDDDTIYMYPTGTAVDMMDVFKQKNGRKKLEDILHDQLNRPVTVEITENIKKQPKKAIEEHLKDVLGDIKPLD